MKQLFAGSFDSAEAFRKHALSLAQVLSLPGIDAFLLPYAAQQSR